MGEKGQVQAKTIMILDDEEAILRLMRMRLEQMGFTVLTSADHAEALRMLKEKRVSALLLDLHLNGISGFDFLPQIKTIDPGLPVIMVTGCHDEVEARKAMELGAWDYVTKPIDFDYLNNILAFPDSK